MKKLARIFVVAVMGGLFLSGVAFANSASTEKMAKGKYYNEVFSTWSKKDFSIYVFETGDLYVAADTGLGWARGRILKREIPDFVAKVKKAREWADTAKANQADITKEVGSFMRGESYNQSGVKLTFFSHNGAKQTDLIMEVVDWENSFNSVELYIEPDQVDVFINMLEEIPALTAEVEKKKANADLFK